MIRKIMWIRYTKQQRKLKAIIDEIKKCNSIGQPVLVGTTSIENSEQISKILSKENKASNIKC